MSPTSADEQRSCDWTALGNRATHSYPDSRTLSTKPASKAEIRVGCGLSYEVTFLCRNRRPPDEIPGPTRMRLHRQQIDPLDAAIAEIDQESHGTEDHWSREVANFAGSLSSCDQRIDDDAFGNVNKISSGEFAWVAQNPLVPLRSSIAG